VSAGRLLAEALEAERAAYEAILAGEPAAEQLRVARDAYLESHRQTGERSWGRLIGALKMAVLAGDGAEAIARDAVAETEGFEGPVAAYARALAQLVLGLPVETEALTAAGDAFARTARALTALAADDGPAYEAALCDILEDFASRDQHLARMPIADTALVLETIADERGLAARPAHPMLPIYCEGSGL
jgi:hypothetical protein